MCGFVGYIGAPGASAADLAAWSDCIRHRGPDQQGQASAPGFGIGTRRLSILDLSAAGDQPMQSDRFLLGFNGEIYNHLELRAQLAAEAPVEFRSHSDTETVLRAIERWGLPETLRRLNGMFALALWDRERAELTLARDPLGVKPLLYTQVGSTIYFGSELKALLPYTGRRLDPAGVALYLMLGFVPAPHSLIEGVQKLRPGEALIFRDGAMRRLPFTPLAWEQAPAPAGGPGQRAEQVRAAVEAAVRRQLLSDLPVGVFLSGGVDSTIIASVGAAGAELTSFSIRPDGAFADRGAELDADLAARCARRLGLTHHELCIRPAELTAELEALLPLLDEPVSELYVAAEVLLSRRARAAGVPVVLTGHGGDELFLGYPTYQAVRKGDRYNRVPFFGPLARALAHAPSSSAAARENLLGAASVWRKPPADRYARVSSVHYSAAEAAAIAGISAERAEALLAAVVAEAQAAAERLPRSGPLSTAALFGRMDLLLKVPEHYNMRLDKATMAASVEARVPLQDLALVGEVLRIGDEELMHGGPKGLLKLAFADMLPPEVAQRPKQTFQAPLLSWVRGTMAPWVAAQLDRAPASLRERAPGLGQPPQTSHQAYRTWSVALLEAWRHHLGISYRG